VYFGRERNNKKFKTNKVDTAKYNGWNFLPKSIFLQFIRPANTFYLVVAILQCFSVISSLSPVASVAPFIVVIAVSVIR
jgi:phospholipid-translocating ATPase